MNYINISKKEQLFFKNNLHYVTKIYIITNVPMNRIFAINNNLYASLAQLVEQRIRNA